MTGEEPIRGWLAVAAEEALERIDPVEPPDLFAHAIGSQQIAHPPIRNQGSTKLSTLNLHPAVPRPLRGVGRPTGSSGLLAPYIVDHAGGAVVPSFDGALRVDLGVDPHRAPVADHQAALRVDGSCPPVLR